MSSKPCIYKNQYFASQTEVADLLNITPTCLAARKRAGTLTGIEVITMEEYEKKTGKEHPNRQNNQHLKNPVEKVVGISATSHTINTGWPAINKADWRGAEGEL